MSEVLTEICKIDPSFDKEQFVRMCEQEVIPNVLEVSWFVCFQGGLRMGVVCACVRACEKGEYVKGECVYEKVVRREGVCVYEK